LTKIKKILLPCKLNSEIKVDQVEHPAISADNNLTIIRVVVRHLVYVKVNSWIKLTNFRDKTPFYRRTSTTKHKFSVKRIVIWNKINSFKAETKLSTQPWQTKDSSSRKSMKENTLRWLTQLTRQFRL